MPYGSDVGSSVAMLAAYVCAIGAATVYHEALTPVAVAELLSSSSSPGFYCTMWKDLIGTLVIWIFSVLFGNSSFYDAYWSVAPPLILYDFCLQSWAVGAATGWTPRMLVVTAIVHFWSHRLTLNWYRSWDGLSHEDWRYLDIKAAFTVKLGLPGPIGSALYWLVGSFFGVHFLPTFMVWAACLGLWPIVMAGAGPLSPVEWAGAAVAAAGPLVQMLADNELRSFRDRPNKPKEAVLDTGLWAYSRHPNYFGEMLMWNGVFIMAYGADPTSASWIIAGPATINILFFFISVPMIEERSLRRRPNTWPDYCARVSVLVPWFPSAAKKQQ